MNERSRRTPLLCKLGLHDWRIGGRRIDVHIGDEEKPWKCRRCGRRDQGKPWPGLESL